MNNILMCRVWDKVDNVYWSKKTIKANAGWLLFPNDNIEDVIVERSTGLKDKNGNLIYEGDIVRFEIVDDDSVLGKTFERICEICFGKGDYPYSFVCKNNAYYRGYALLSSILCQEIESIEIIGNIHKTKE